MLSTRPNLADSPEGSFFPNHNQPYTQLDLARSLLGQVQSLSTLLINPRDEQFWKVHPKNLRDGEDGDVIGLRKG